jgi:hypothetical protein
MKRSGGIAFVVTMLLSALVAGAQADDRLNEALDAPVNLQFENAYVRNVCRSLGDEHGIKILLDDGVIAPIGRTVAKPYVTDGRVQYINLKEVTVREALNAILTPLGLTYVVKERYVWVTTPERMNIKPYSDLETQVFEVPAGKASEISNDSMGESNLVLLLRKVVPMVVEPDTGELLSYMRYNLLTKQLVVHNTPENLDTVQRLFELISDDSQPKQQ